MPLNQEAAAIDAKLRQFDSELITIAEKHKLRLSQVHGVLSQAVGEYQIEMEDFRRRFKSWRLSLTSVDQPVTDE